MNFQVLDEEVCLWYIICLNLNNIFWWTWKNELWRFNCEIQRAISFIQVVKKMSTDRRLLYKLILGISKGNISSVEDSTIGPVNQARWLTLASRVLRLYCSPPDNLGTYGETVLERLSIFIVKVYFKVSTSDIITIIDN